MGQGGAGRGGGKAGHEVLGMGHGAWGTGHGAVTQGHGAWGMEHGAWGMGHGAVDGMRQGQAIGRGQFVCITCLSNGPNGIIRPTSQSATGVSPHLTKRQPSTRSTREARAVMLLKQSRYLVLYLHSCVVLWLCSYWVMHLCSYVIM